MATSMGVEIISRETIKPSSPTPQSHKIFKLSVLDQLAPNFYVPVVLFYSKPSATNISELNGLKKSLSKALTHMYPLAGRLRDEFSVECNDEGAEFVEARVVENMSLVLEHPKIDLLLQLLPCDPHKKAAESNHVILAVQVSYFGDGGMAIAVCIRHEIADGSSVATFLNTWAKIDRDGDNAVTDESGFVFDCTALFPPQDVAGISVWPSNEKVEAVIRKTVHKRFVFNSSKIAGLREKASEGLNGFNHCPTRIESLLAFLWAAFVSINKDTHDGIKTFLLFTVVDLRKRMNPPLPPNSIGNIHHWAVAHYQKASVDYKELVKRVREAIRAVNEGNVRKLHADGAYVDMIKYAKTAFHNCDEVRVFATSSWCRFPFYEADFGWGKPVWVGNAMKVSNFATFMDTRDGEGIEAWVSLLPEDMEKLDQNLVFLAYVSSSQTL